jgi:protein-S-isoprenylcysteine O-methyltransferase Ste14
MYLGGIIGYFGLFLFASKSWIQTIVFMAFVVSFCLDRIDREDQLLYQKFGEDFYKYMMKTKALIPGVI